MRWAGVKEATHSPVVVLRELQGFVTEVGDTAYNRLVSDESQLNGRVAKRKAPN